MNNLIGYNNCTLTDKELIELVDNHVDNMYKTGRIPRRHLPAKPNSDFDLVLGELLQRFNNLSSSDT